MDPVLTLVRRHHVVIVASLRERVLGELLETPVVDDRTALRVGATHLHLRGREAARLRMSGLGAHCIDSEPRHLPAQLVNRYWDIKAAGVL